MSEEHQQGEDLIYELSNSIMGEELSPELLAKLAAVQCLNSSTLDSTKYIICVDNLEAVLDAKLDAEYLNEIEKRATEIGKQGEMFAQKEGPLILARFKFRQLMRLIDRKKPQNEVLKT